MTRRHRLPILATAFVIAVLAGPLLVLAVQAVAKAWFYPQVVPSTWTLTPLARLAQSPPIRQAVVTSLAVSTAATVLSLALAIPAARAIAVGTAGRRLAVVFAIPVVLPPLALAMGLDVVFLRAGFALGAVTVTLAHLVATLPYAVLLLSAALLRYDTGYERQALALGASRSAVLFRVFLPLAMPAIAVSAALTFLVSWGQYLLTLLPGGGATTTLPVLVLAAVRGGNPAAGAALALVAAVPPMVAIVAVTRHLERPLGAVA